MSRRAFGTLEKPPIEESYDYAEQVRRQIERCLEATAIQDDDIREGTYRACVLGLSNLVPHDDRDKDFENALDACTVNQEYYLFKKFGGVAVGTIENPITVTGDDGEEIIISPILETEKVTDWDRYFMVLFNKFVELKVTVRRGTFGG